MLNFFKKEAATKSAVTKYVIVKFENGKFAIRIEQECKKYKYMYLKRFNVGNAWYSYEAKDASYCQVDTYEDAKKMLEEFYDDHKEVPIDYGTPYEV